MAVTSQWDRELPSRLREIAALSEPLICVLAGPGTGKTTALIRNAARLLEEGAEPQKLLIVTFTRTAATDLLRQLNDLEHIGAPTVDARTIHSLCFRMLRMQSVLEITGRVARPLMDYETTILLDDLTDPRFAGRTDKKKRIEALGAGWARLADETPGWLNDPLDIAFARDLDAWLRFHKAMLISELVPVALSFLRNNPNANLRGFYRHVFVDEYQDLNNAEQALAELMAEAATYFVVGDDDQSIYRFKYAHPEGIINFPEHHAGTHSEALEDCGRCPVVVIEMANSLIAQNTRPLPDRRMRPTETCPDGEAHIVQWQNLTEETKGLARFVQWYTGHHQLASGRVLILSPRRVIGYKIRDQLRELGVPAQSHFSEQALDPPFAQEKFSLLTLLADQGDRVALRNWLGSPTARPASYRWLREECLSSGDSPWELLEKLSSGAAEAPSNVRELVTRFETLREEIAKLEKLEGQELVQTWLPESDSGDEEGDPLEELRRTALELLPEEGDPPDVATLREQVREAISQPSAPIESDSVRIMSLHKSKGLGADLVIICGCVEGLVPFEEERLAPLESAEVLEEQRRLFYVALTRSKQCVVLSSSRYFNLRDARRMNLRYEITRNYVVESIASRFLAELGPTAPLSQRGEQWLSHQIA